MDIERADFSFADEGSDLFDPRKLINALWRGKWRILLMGALGALSAIAFIARMEPTYTSRATILFEPEQLQIMDFAKAIQEPNAGPNLGDQMEILASNMLLSRVATALGMDAPPETEVAAAQANGTGPSGQPSAATEQQEAAQGGSLLDRVLDTADRATTPPTGGQTDLAQTIPPSPEAEREARIRKAVLRLRQNLSLSQVPGARVIEVGFTSGDPTEAARIANAVSAEYLLVQDEAEKDRTRSIVDTLNARIEELKVRLDESEQAVAQARLDLSRKQAESSDMTVVQLNTLNGALADMRLKRTEAEGRYQRAAQALDSQEDLWKVTEFRESSLISNLRSRELEVLQGIAEGKAITGDSRTPSGAVADARLDEIRKNIRDEASYIVAALKFEVDSFRAREAQLESMIRDLEVVRIQQTADELHIDRLEREALANRNLYESFVDRLKEITEQSNLPSTGARILSPAEVPGSPDRTSANRLLIAATFGALALGSVLVIFLERIKNAFHNPNDLSEATGLRVIASIPQIGRTKTVQKLVSGFLAKPNGILAESIRNLRTSILFADPANPPKVVMLTSSVPNEGKSSLSLLMGITSQQMGRRSVLVACDLRDKSNKKLYSAFPKLDSSAPNMGLASLLEGECSLDEALVIEPKSGLHVLSPALKEDFVGSPADLLASDRFTSLMNELRQRYDLIILDTPPALAVTDARLLSRVSDTAVYLVRWNRTSRNAVREGLKELASMSVPIAGCVFTCVSQREAAKYTDNEFFYKQSYSGYFN